MAKQLVTSAGLLLDIIGVALIYFFAIADAGKGGYVEHILTAGDIRRNSIGRLGFWLVVLGFALQIASTWIPTSA